VTAEFDREPSQSTASEASTRLKQKLSLVDGAVHQKSSSPKAASGASPS
jgi:hypothetical protein